MQLNKLQHMFLEFAIWYTTFLTVAILLHNYFRQVLQMWQCMNCKNINMLWLSWNNNKRSWIYLQYFQIFPAAMLRIVKIIKGHVSNYIFKTYVVIENLWFFMQLTLKTMISNHIMLNVSIHKNDNLSILFK